MRAIAEVGLFSESSPLALSSYLPPLLSTALSPYHPQLSYSTSAAVMDS